ncbi:MAG: hypothetical protein J6K61_01220 [Clostridia bacterium]|nr:hypothetical protein [Clostridia bacterium]
MKTIFKKSNISFLKQTLHGGSGRELWTLARMMQEKDGLQHQLPAVIHLLQNGAAAGDVWSMDELARMYFHHAGDLFLPQACSLWKKAALQKDNGAMGDLQSLPIYDRIMAYRSPDGNAYTAMEMKCALLTEYHLTRLGLSPWEELDTEARKERCKALVYDACRVLTVKQVELSFVPGLVFEGVMVDGLAGWDWKITVREELLSDFERLIEVLFHELGHIVTFEIRKRSEEGEHLKGVFGISDERIRSWEQNEMGYEVVTAEEDPDTLSYGVYTLWAAFFALGF